MLDTYTDFLLCSFGQASATNLSRLSDGQISHDRVTRFLNAECQNSAALWRYVKPLVRQVEQDDGVLIIDDSSAEKAYTDESNLICWHWDHSKERNIKGINFLTVIYQTSEAVLPVAFDLVTKPVRYSDVKTHKEKRCSDQSKNERFRMLLHITQHNQIRYRWVLTDLWFASAANMNYVCGTLHKDFIFPLKENRKVALCREDQQKGRFQAVSNARFAGR